jgi:tetratricopeptide (TPR) repeat protein
MIKRILIFGIFLLLTNALHAQSQQELKRKGDSCFYAKNYSLAIETYRKGAEMAEFRSLKNANFYNIACCYALTNNIEEAFKSLRLALDNGYNNIDHLRVDPDLNALHDDSKWEKLINSIKPTFTTNPLKIKINTDDIDIFWKAYNIAEKEGADKVKVYRKSYLEEGSDGLDDFWKSKIISVESFVKGHNQKKKFYPTIKATTEKLNDYKKEIISDCVKLKEFYPDARFPNTYLLIGNFESRSYISGNGLLIAAEVGCKTPDVPVDELTPWEKSIFKDLNNFPITVMREVIRFQQPDADAFNGDTTLLANSIKEGMADFITELVFGKLLHQSQHDFAKGKEKIIWEKFKKEMMLNRTKYWIGSDSQENKDMPADMGYWVGYQICKAYYEESEDKKQSISEMITLQEFVDFLELSKFEEKIK